MTTSFIVHSQNQEFVTLIDFLFHFQKNLYRAFPYALKACELGIVESCVNVSVMYKKGDGIKKVRLGSRKS